MTARRTDLRRPGRVPLQRLTAFRFDLTPAELAGQHFAWHHLWHHLMRISMGVADEDDCHD
jgi:hypothetical protein